VFLGRLIKGGLFLFYYKGKGLKIFFLKKGDNKIVEVPKRNKDDPKSSFQDQLKKTAAGYYYVADTAKLVSLNKKSLTKLIEGCNKHDLPLFSFLRFGINTGYGASKLQRI